LRFWDSSALLSLLVLEPASWKTRDLFRRDPEMALWWGTSVECAGTLARIKREGRLARQTLQHAWVSFEDLFATVLEIQPAEEVRSTAKRLLSEHSLRAADALQLAAALFWRDGYPAGASFVCLDRQLRLAASLEGFRVLPYADEIHEAVLGVESGFVLRDHSVPYGEPVI
jgi:predicted nucleic acid-binding protein